MQINGRNVDKTWKFSSSSGHGVYETVQYSDGDTSCNCPGWTRRVQPDGSRTCKHTRMVDEGVADQGALSNQNYAAGGGPRQPARAQRPAQRPQSTIDDAPAPSVKIRKIQWN